MEEDLVEVLKAKEEIGLPFSSIELNGDGFVQKIQQFSDFYASLGQLTEKFSHLAQQSLQFVLCLGLVFGGFRIFELKISLDVFQLEQRGIDHQFLSIHITHVFCLILEQLPQRLEEIQHRDVNAQPTGPCEDIIKIAACLLDEPFKIIIELEPQVTLTYQFHFKSHLEKFSEQSEILRDFFIVSRNEEGSLSATCYGIYVYILDQIRKIWGFLSDNTHKRVESLLEDGLKQLGSWLTLRCDCYLYKSFHFFSFLVLLDMEVQFRAIDWLGLTHQDCDFSLLGLLLWFFFEGLLTRRGRRGCALLRLGFFHAGLDLFSNIDQTVLGLPHLMLRGGLKRVIILLCQLKIQGGLLRIAIVDLSDGLHRDMVLLW